MDQAAAERCRPHQCVEGLRMVMPRPSGHGHRNNDADHAEQPDERQSAARLLGDDVPDRVAKRAGQDENECGGGHRWLWIVSRLRR